MMTMVMARGRCWVIAIASQFPFEEILRQGLSLIVYNIISINDASECSIIRMKGSQIFRQIRHLMESLFLSPARLSSLEFAVMNVPLSLGLNMSRARKGPERTGMTL